MNNRNMKSNSLRYSELISGLRRKKIIKARDYFNLSNDIVNYKNSILGLTGSDSVFFYANTKAYTSYQQEIYMEDHVGLLFIASGVNFLKSHTEQVKFGQCVAVISFNMNYFESIRSAGTEVRNLGIILPLQELIEDYGLQYERLPRYVQLALRKNLLAPARMIINLSPRSRIIMEDIFNKRIFVKLGEKYIAAKTIELICELVLEINNNLMGHNLGSIKSKSCQDQQIFAAAKIYERSLGQMPSLDQVASIVGINRNQLNDGFKSVYGKTPGEYARFMRLEWAKNRLDEGNCSVSEISKMCGYSSAGAFSRAFKYLYGRTPAER